MKMLTTLGNRPLLIGLVLVMTSLLLGKLIILSGISFPVVGDAPNYLIVAENVSNYTYPPHKNHLYPPGYPVALAVIIGGFGGSIETVYLAQFMLLGGIAWLTYLITWQRFGVPATLALGAGLITLIWPYFILYSLLIYAEIVYTFLLLSALYFVLTGWEQNENLYLAIAGVLIGLATLTKPVALLLPFWIVGFIAIYQLYKKRRVTIKKELFFSIVAFALTILPWSIYVSIQAGTPTPVATYLSSVQEKSSNLGYEENRVAPSEAAVETSEVIISKLKNIYRFWDPGAGGTQAAQLSERMPIAEYFFLLYKLGFFIILALAFLSLRYPHRRGWFLWLTILYFWSLHTVLFPYPRYTLPIIPLVIILATHSFYSILWRK